MHIDAASIRTPPAVQKHFDVLKASDLLAFRRAISGGLFRTPGHKVALATTDSANATGGRASRRGLDVLLPAASSST